MKLLVVDDSKAMRLIVKRTLRQAGYGDATVKEAENGRMALEVIEDFSPDLILCDWNMPVMNGLELLHEIKARDLAIKFGFVTSEGTEAMRKMAAVAGALFLIHKPFTADEFRKKLGTVLKSEGGEHHSRIYPPGS